MIWVFGLAFVFSLFALRRAAPLMFASLAGIAIWRLADDLPATIASIAAVYATTAWLLDAAANRPVLRRASIAIEIVAAGALVGGVAAQVTGRHDLLAWWTAADSSAAAMAIVARWRSVAY